MLRQMSRQGRTLPLFSGEERSVWHPLETGAPQSPTGLLELVAVAERYYEEHLEKKPPWEAYLYRQE